MISRGILFCLALITNFSEQEQEIQDAQNKDDSVYEFVSAETVQEIVVWVYKTSMRLQH